MKRFVCSFIVLCVGVVLLTSLACEYQVTSIKSVPTPALISSNKDTNEVHYRYSKWKEGLRLLVVNSGSGSEYGKGTVDGDNYLEEVKVELPNGKSYKTELVTTDGKTAKFKIDNKEYDLTIGTVFAIQADGEKIEVHQFNKDLSKLETMPECSQFVASSTDIQNAVRGKK